MINDDLVAGLKLSLEKGESLKKAMNTFLNAGYKKEDIEDSANALERTKSEVQLPSPVISEQYPAKIKSLSLNPPKLTEQYSSSNSLQKISDYGKKKFKFKKFFIILIILFIVIIGFFFVIFLLNNL